ncbi:hypothetical protein HU200_061493 [Digitaria exilis]|uniref:F-box domain-containing protein n=1 Tax=Digitaria exilis TaxID=1010633 RepID=A0A835AET8_9POAL|nr:hypothetical protein HU200_061493 [Digitaria exilis]
MPPQLPDDVVEEILARFPPDEPAHLVRAALACKAWHRIVSGAGFRRRLHGRAPSLLGFFHHHGSHPAYFNPTSPFRPTYAARAGWLILNGRHGRFLVRKMTTTSPFTPPSMEDAELIVWDPPLTSSTECPCRPSSTRPGARHWSAPRRRRRWRAAATTSTVHVVPSSWCSCSRTTRRRG